MYIARRMDFYHCMPMTL